jgi:hypothetical protein
MIGLGWIMFRRRGRLLFVNKKKQKNFFKLSHAGFAVTGPAKQKFFAPLFFKKAASFLFQAEPVSQPRRSPGWRLARRAISDRFVKNRVLMEAVTNGGYAKNVQSALAAPP